MGGLGTIGKPEWAWKIENKIDPGAHNLGLFGKTAEDPIDPATFTGIYGYKMNPGKLPDGAYSTNAPDRQAALVAAADQTAINRQRASSASGSLVPGATSSSKLLLGQ